MTIRHFLLAALIPLTAFASSVQARETLPDGTTRPTIALVLAGGGAKGAAHIGILQALEEMNIPVDIITGTSMGAYVGGLYSLGLSAQEIEDMTNNIDWNSGYDDRVDRSERRVRDKEYEDRYQLHTDLGLRWLEVKVPKGVVQGQNMMHILRQSTGNLPAVDSFDDFPIKYRSVATDIVDLKPVVLGDGELVDAMMSSMSVPGALPPYPYRGMLLVDGGVTNNMPVDLARSMGADIVIAVDISSDYKTIDELNTILSVGDQLSNYMVRRTTQVQSEMLNDQDVLLQPQVGYMATTDFSNMPEAYKLGYKEAQLKRAQLQRYSVDDATYANYKQHKQQVRSHLRKGSDLTINEVRIENNTHYNPKLIEHRLDIETGVKYNADEIESKVRNLYALDRFEKVSYEYEDNGDGTANLDVVVNEKSWGPNYLDFRLFMEDNFDNESKYSVGFTANFTDLSDYGAELRTNFEIGSDKLLGVELYVPMSYDQTYFMVGSAEYTDEKSNLFIPEGFSLNSTRESNSTDLSDTENSLPIDYVKWTGDIAFGIQPALWQEIRLGLRYTDGSTSLSGLPAYGDMDYTRQGVYAQYRVDTLDDYSFPSKGFLINLEYLLSKDSVDEGGSTETDNVSEFSSKFLAAKSFGKHTLAGQFNYGIVDSENAQVPLDPKELGGFLNLSGIPRDSLSGRNKVFTSLVYRYKWFDNDFGLFQSPVYLGASVEYGGVWADAGDKWDNDSLYMAGSVFTGIDSPIGPVILAYGQTEDHYNSVYLIVGSTF